MSIAKPFVLTDEIRANRVAVAKDVRLQIAGQKLNLICGAYLHFDTDLGNTLVSFNYTNGYTLNGISPTDNAQEHIEQIQASCKVCARGALVLSKVRLLNNATVSDLLATHDDVENGNFLADLFDTETFSRIEAAYMQDSSFGSLFDGLKDEAAEFGWAIDDEDARLDAIMANLIENNGEFIPPPITDNAGAPQ